MKIERIVMTIKAAPFKIDLGTIRMLREDYDAIGMPIEQRATDTLTSLLNTLAETHDTDIKTLKKMINAHDPTVLDGAIESLLTLFE